VKKDFRKNSKGKSGRKNNKAQTLLGIASEK
jgi:hypothetical protein